MATNDKGFDTATGTDDGVVTAVQQGKGDTTRIAAKAQSAENAPEDRVDRLGTEKIGKLIAEFAIPAIAGMFFNGLYNIIDGIFMGHGVGEVGLATATVSMPIMQFSMAVSTLLGAGGNALVALRLGEGRKEEAEKILGVCFTLGLLAAVLCTVLLNVLMEPLLRLQGVNDAIIESCETFIRIISFGMVLQFLGMGFNNYIRTAGDPFRALYTMAAGIVVSTVFNWVFVLILKWGVAGSAWATIMGQGTSCVLVMYYFCVSKTAPFKLRVKNMGLQTAIIGSIIALGSASFFMQIINAFLNIFVNNTIAYFGSLSPIGSGGAFAGLGVSMRAGGMTFFPIMGCAVAAQPLFGYNYGAKNYERVKETYFTSFKWMALIGLGIFVIVEIFATNIAMIFGVKDELLTFTSTSIRVGLSMVPIMGLQMLSANYFQSSGQPMKSLFLSMTRQALYMLPLINILPRVLPLLFPSMSPVDGIYWSYPLADLLAVLTSVLVIRSEFKKLDGMIAEQKEGLPEQAVLVT